MLERVAKTVITITPTQNAQVYFLGHLTVHASKEFLIGSPLCDDLFTEASFFRRLHHLLEFVVIRLMEQENVKTENRCLKSLERPTSISLIAVS